MVKSVDVQQKIAQILQRLETGTCTPQELQWLQDWYESQDAQPMHTFRDEAHQQQLQADMLQHIHARLEPVSTPVVRMRYRWQIAAAVMAGVIGMAGWWFFKNWQPKHDMIIVQVAAGQQMDFALPDSSHVWLNAGARMEYPRQFGEVRAVKLDGEAFFDIQPDARHPFEVHTQEINVQVLGTSFDVKAYSTLDETQVTVKTGMVKVLHDQKGLDVLSANDQLTFSRSAQQYMKSKADNQQINEWASGMISLSQVGFAELALTLENQYGVHIRYNPAEMKHDEYTLRCSKQLSITQVLDLVSSIHPLQYDMKEKEITIHRKN
ncbi:FecR family protein [Chitinophaga arvensicola]|uniref:Ferric-dicitrate binding protein FerR, regulates iron transport through sigma-19 n=1 Tax=Chitinophaga arvensicola TaxID=29529 RepID=A0A1I0RJB6_9BACT|nr:FecR family protein [Chitinophaga arvensicola]SEW41091.1 ferric-dicitrate binding protein FerR, regulates iron transport through sigma-19 [Chitinophaga arvensicola]